MRARPEALASWSPWQCYCGVHGESVDGDSALRAWRTHYLNAHHYGPLGTLANGVMGLALSSASVDDVDVHGEQEMTHADGWWALRCKCGFRTGSYTGPMHAREGLREHITHATGCAA